MENDKEMFDVDLDADIEAHKERFTTEKFERLMGYRRLLATAIDHLASAETGRNLTREPLGKILGDDFDDYFTLIKRLD
jgi:hypothetical protein